MRDPKKQDRRRLHRDQQNREKFQRRVALVRVAQPQTPSRRKSHKANTQRQRVMRSGKRECFEVRKLRYSAPPPERAAAVCH